MANFSQITAIEDENKEASFPLCLEALGMIRTKSDHIFSELVELTLAEETGGSTKALLAQYLLQNYQKYIERSLTALILREQLLSFSRLEEEPIN